MTSHGEHTKLNDCSSRSTVGAEHVFEMAMAEDEDPVEAIGAESADPALGVSLRVRRLWRRATSRIFGHPPLLSRY
jgi:hypothetical protein